MHTLGEHVNSTEKKNWGIKPMTFFSEATGNHRAICAFNTLLETCTMHIHQLLIYSLI